MGASLGSLRSVTTPGSSQSPRPFAGMRGRNRDSHDANCAGGSMRRMKSASPRQGDRKSSPDGSYASGQSRQIAYQVQSKEEQTIRFDGITYAFAGKPECQ